jgi:hypothetical protein
MEGKEGKWLQITQGKWLQIWPLPCAVSYEQYTPPKAITAQGVKVAGQHLAGDTLRHLQPFAFSRFFRFRVRCFFSCFVK